MPTAPRPYCIPCKKSYLHTNPTETAGLLPRELPLSSTETVLVPITLGAELDAGSMSRSLEGRASNKARSSLFFVHQPRAIEPIYGDLAWALQLTRGGATAHAIETSAWRDGLGVRPIGWLDFERVRGLLELEDGQELLHAHVGGLTETPHASGDWEEGVI